MTVLHKLEPLTATPTDWVVEDIPAGTFRVNRAALIDEAVFRDEMRSIFDRCWLYVGHESEIPKPGDFRARDVGNRPLVFWHGHDGVKRVFYNTCRHRGALVCRVPEGNTRTMNCFYHAWTYGSTGALNGLPGEEGYGPTFDRASMSLLSPAKVDSYRGFVFACFDPGAVDLRTYLAGAADYIDLVADQAEAMEIVPGAHEYSADANWKLFVENSLDGYHVLPLHITYFEYLEQTEGSRPTLGDLSEAIDLGNGHAAVRFRGPWARPVARWTPALGERQPRARRGRLRRVGPQVRAGASRVDRPDRSQRADLPQSHHPRHHGHRGPHDHADLGGAHEDHAMVAGHRGRGRGSAGAAARELHHLPGSGRASRRRMISRHSRPARPAFAPRPACRGRTSPAACTASTAASPAAPTTSCRCAHSGDSGRPS